MAPFLSDLFGFTYNTNYKIAIGGGYILYLILGYLISEYEISKSNRYIIYILGIIGLLAHIFGTWYLSYEAGTVVQTYKGYTNVPCVLYSTAIFVFFRYMDLSKIGKTLRNIVNFMSQYTFSVYLMHYFVIDIFRRICGVDITGLKNRIIFPFVVIAICILIAYPIKKIPIIKRILP